MKYGYLVLLFSTLVTQSCSGVADREGGAGNVFDLKDSIETSAKTSDWNPAAPWKLPAGYSQEIVSSEANLNIYPQGRDDLNDMLTVNESGPEAGRYLYRTHEVSLGKDKVIDGIGGSISVIDLKTGIAKVLVQDVNYTALDGIRWTPWGTLLIGSETESGHLYEVALNNDMMSAKSVHDRSLVGRLAHEGIEVDGYGNVYVVDEHRGHTVGCEDVVPCGGGIYKFVSNTFGDLSSGKLYVLKVNGADGVGQGEWTGPIDPLNARLSAAHAGGQSYQRPEDLEIIDDVLYVAITEGPGDDNVELYDGRVLAINLKTMQVTNFVKPGVNVPVEIGQPGDQGHQTGFDNVDNLAESPDGNLVMIEDNIPSDIWVASTVADGAGASSQVKLFASLTDPQAEGSGIYFSPVDPKTLYVNVQHSAADDGDATWAIRKSGD